VSSYFNNLFFAQWKEKGQEEFIIREEDDPNFDICTFQLMIYAALPLGRIVPELLELFKGDFLEKFHGNQSNVLVIYAKCFHRRITNV
jgi:hypothetical protein